MEQNILIFISVFIVIWIVLIILIKIIKKREREGMEINEEEDAFNKIKTMEGMVNEIKNMNIETSSLESMLNKAKRMAEDKNFQDVFDIYNDFLISYRRIKQTGNVFFQYKYETAEEDKKKVLEELPKDYLPAKFWLSKAEEALDKMDDKTKEEAMKFMSLAKSYFDSKDYTESIKYSNKVVRILNTKTEEKREYETSKESMEEYYMPSKFLIQKIEGNIKNVSEDKRNEIEEHLKKAKEYFDQGYYRDAMIEARKAEEFYGDTIKLTNEKKKEEKKIEEAEEIDKYYLPSKYWLNKAERDIQSLPDEYRSELELKVSMAKNSFNDKNYFEAMKISIEVDREIQSILERIQP
ncbi:MAG: hypothetical protein ACP5RZ_03955 [Thermoplasmata archaeon]